MASAVKCLTDFTVDAILRDNNIKITSETLIDRFIELTLNKKNNNYRIFNCQRPVNFIEICSFNGLLTTRKVIGI